MWSDNFLHSFLIFLHVFFSCPTWLLYISFCWLMIFFSCTFWAKNCTLRVETLFFWTISCLIEIDLFGSKVLAVCLKCAELDLFMVRALADADYAEALRLSNVRIDLPTILFWHVPACELKDIDRFIVGERSVLLLYSWSIFCCIILGGLMLLFSVVFKLVLFVRLVLAGWSIVFNWWWSLSCVPGLKAALLLFLLSGSYVISVVPILSWSISSISCCFLLA